VLAKIEMKKIEAKMTAVQANLEVVIFPLFGFAFYRSTILHKVTVEGIPLERENFLHLLKTGAATTVRQ
jgi:hypothetical protein